MAEIKSTDDARTENTMRHKYRVLADHEKQLMDEIKDLGEAFDAKLQRVLDMQGNNAIRELGQAKIKIEEAVMWAVKGLTK